MVFNVSISERVSTTLKPNPPQVMAALTETEKEAHLKGKLALLLWWRVVLFVVFGSVEG
jgi:hypothetical protein